jgi:hypothetical protein
MLATTVPTGDSPASGNKPQTIGRFCKTHPDVQESERGSYWSKKYPVGIVVRRIWLKTANSPGAAN